MPFTALKLIQPLLDAIKSSGYDKPSPIQLKVIPEILNGRDIMAAAQTGTGKTAGFTLPILQMLADGEKAKANTARALILTPTRELAAQVAESVKTYGANLPLSSFVVFGGVKINPQMIRLRRGVDVLVATPGRLLDLMGQNAIKFPSLEFLVLDEADRMLDMGFLPDIKRIMAKLPENRQTLLFSATFSEEIKTLCHKMLKEPVAVSVSPQNSTATTVAQLVYPVDKKRKSALLSYLIGQHRWQQVLVFVRTRRGANKLAYDLQKSGIQAEAIHGDKSQGTRTRVLSAFKKGELQALIATDIAARGLDIDQLPHVVNFDLPNVAEDYVHRIGRTGRAGASGEAISLVSADEVEHLSGIENLIRKKLPRKLIDGFEPDHTVPETTLNTIIKGKKPHKKKLAKSAEKQKVEGKRPSNKKRPTRNRKPDSKPGAGSDVKTAAKNKAVKSKGNEDNRSQKNARKLDTAESTRSRRKPTSKTANFSGLK